MSAAPDPDRVAPPAAARPRRSSRVVMLVAVCAALALTAGLVWRPAPDRLPADTVGDAALGQLGRELVGEDRPALAVACVTPTTLRTAVMGTGVTDRFEIGSISKGLTGLLFADMIDRGEVTPDTRLGTLLPATGALGDVTLSQLATHTSGLPVQLPTIGQVGRNFWSTLTAGNPYDGTIQQRLDELHDVPLDAPPGTYSNLGFELLGAALAAAADRPYRELLRERVLTPAGMAETTVPYADDELTSADLLGQTAGGRTADAWLGPAMAPAGGVRADIGEMAGLTQRLLTGRAPGTDALQPKVDVDDSPTGWAWITQPSPVDQRSVTWHNGGTGGFTSFLGIDPERKIGVVLLSARQESPNLTTRAGFELLNRIGDCA